MTVAEVDVVARAFHDGVANRDAAALASLYADHGRFLPPGVEPCEGRDEIEAAMQQLLDMGASSSAAHHQRRLPSLDDEHLTTQLGWTTWPMTSPSRARCWTVLRRAGRSSDHPGHHPRAV